MVLQSHSHVHTVSICCYIRHLHSVLNSFQQISPAETHSPPFKTKLWENLRNNSVFSKICVLSGEAGVLAVPTSHKNTTSPAMA